MSSFSVVFRSLFSERRLTYHHISKIVTMKTKYILTDGLNNKERIICKRYFKILRKYQEK